MTQRKQGGRVRYGGRGENMAYIEGAGDVIAESVRQIGYTVDSMES